MHFNQLNMHANFVCNDTMRCIWSSKCTVQMKWCCRMLFEKPKRLSFSMVPNWCFEVIAYSVQLCVCGCVCFVHSFLLSICVKSLRAMVQFEFSWFTYSTFSVHLLFALVRVPNTQNPNRNRCLDAIAFEMVMWMMHAKSGQMEKIEK